MLFNKEDLKQLEGNTMALALLGQLEGELGKIVIVSDIEKNGRILEVVANELDNPLKAHVVTLNVDKDREIIKYFQLGNLGYIEKNKKNTYVVPVKDDASPAKNFTMIRELAEILDVVAERCEGNKQDIILLHNYCALMVGMLNQGFNTFEILGNREKYSAPLASLIDNIIFIEDELKSNKIKNYTLDIIDYLSNSYDIKNICDMVEQGLKKQEIVELPFEEYADELKNYLEYIPSNPQFALNLQTTFPNFSGFKTVYSQNKKARGNWLRKEILKKDFMDAKNLINNSKVLSSFENKDKNTDTYLVMNKITRKCGELFMLVDAQSFCNSFYLLKKHIHNVDKLEVGTVIVAERTKRNRDGLTLDVKDVLDDGSATSRMQNIFDLMELNMIESAYLKSNTKIKLKNETLFKRLREDVDIVDSDCLKFTKKNLFIDSAEIQELEKKGELVNPKFQKSKRTQSSRLKDTVESSAGILKV